MTDNTDSVTKVPGIVCELYSLVAKLESLFPDRRFTPDGHLIGSIGEVIAAFRYNLKLLPHSAKGHDALAPSGMLVEIKATQGKSVALRDEPHHLIVLHLSKMGDASEIYNGPGSPVWVSAGGLQRNGQRSISITKLRKLMIQVPQKLRIPERA